MIKWFSLGFWELIARVVLRNRILMLSIIIAITVLLAMQWKNIHFTFTEANLLPDDNIVNVEYNAFLNKFGEEGNLVIIGVKDNTIFTPKAYASWSKLMNGLKGDKAVDLVISLNDLKKLQKNDSLETFELVPFVDQSKTVDKAYLQKIKKELFNDLPFYEGLLFNKRSGSIRSAVYMDKKIVNTAARKDFILEKLVPAVETFEKETGIDLRVSGMPYIRTLNAKTIVDEISIFIGASLLVTSLLFFFFFRSFRATLISMIIVIIGVMWSFGFLGLLNYEITVLTALVPSLIIVIGIPNCIFLTNKYHQEYKVHRNKVKALQRVTTKVGMATLMTNLTTAIGFATFVASNNQLLLEFGVVTSINIMALFFLCIIVIPIFHSYIPPPKDRHIEHLDRNYVKVFMDWILRNVKYNRFSIYVVAVILLVISIIGIYKMRISGSLIEDMPKKEAFFEDIVFFEKEFDGVMPLEIMIDTKHKKGVMKLSTLKRMEELEETIDEIPELSKPISIVNLVKYSKQAYYNGNPDYYELPTSQEQSFILSYAKNATKNSKDNLMKSYVDSTGQFARITTFMRDENGDNIAKIEAEIRKKANTLFPPDRYHVTITGKALVFQKGTGYLLDNLLSSLVFAFFLTSLLVAFMFRSFKMVLVSIIPNLLPLLLTAGIMGYLDIPLKPSTILVFGIAFGLSVDDTIRFLAQYREELKKNNWKIRKSVYATFTDAGLSMFYTSIVLFFGFSVFMLSSFGGTIALGGLISLTLLFGMLSNLMLLPALVLTLNKTLANEQEFIEPKIDIIEHTDEEIDALKKK
ncbi:efflux RND transporter permease subunit [Flavobacterium gawalongense]|uniref:MMPL family transporter n=1 Tax=Flavobacterium gawalongense TaxID=2594432 RepID=A0A553BLX7_9FLAO|nr:MMPL family transporter [Flavobacterium gawalongense]TRX01256.1 MMPL family transporter [Flavobacterium gawalongense]TRX05219.1 MMPL family transporter [Flavobacterium gawalongense]TRX09245.1 MMPL family transporter [Flavobacterium gawalongense]